MLGLGAGKGVLVLAANAVEAKTAEATADNTARDVVRIDTFMFDPLLFLPPGPDDA